MLSISRFVHMCVCVHVCLCVCLSVCLFTFEVPFKRLFAPLPEGGGGRPGRQEQEYLLQEEEQGGGEVEPGPGHEGQGPQAGPAALGV